MVRLFGEESGKNRYKFRENYGTMLKRYDPVSFEVGFKEWKDEK